MTETSQAGFEFFGRKCVSSDDVRKFLAIRISTLLSATGFIYYLFFTFINNIALAIPGFLISISLAASIFLFQKGYNNIGKYWLIFCTNAAVFHYAIVLGQNSGISNFFFAIAILPFVLFSFKEIFSIFSGMIIPIIGFFCTKISIGQTIFSIQILTAQEITFINILTSFMTFVIVCIGVGAYSLSTDKVMSKLFALVDTLDKSNTELEKQKQAALNTRKRSRVSKKRNCRQKHRT